MSESSETFTHSEMITVMRGAFYDGAQYLYDEHFTSMHPFPAREVMDRACRRYPGRELEEVAINGVKYRYRVDGKVIELFTGFKGAEEWVPAQAITPEAVLILAELIRNPYKAERKGLSK